MNNRNAPPAKPTNSSRSAKKASAEGLGAPQNASVFDYLYHDAQRVGSFLAQFEDAGHLQQITEGDTVAKGTKRGFKFAVGASLPDSGAGAPGGSLSLESTPLDGGAQSTLRVYDPLWTNARTFLDYLATADLIVRDVAQLNMGKFALFTGPLRVMDGNFVKQIFDNPDFGRHALKMSPPEQKAAHTLIQSMYKRMPTVVQATIGKAGNQAWMILNPANMIVPPVDLALKHGFEIAGEWNVLAIVDSLPDVGLPIVFKNIDPKDPSVLLQEIQDYNTTWVGLMGMRQAMEVRNLMGRPRNTFGITPLLIFREISRG